MIHVYIRMCILQYVVSIQNGSTNTRPNVKYIAWKEMTNTKQRQTKPIMRNEWAHTLNAASKTKQSEKKMRERKLSSLHEFREIRKCHLLRFHRFNLKLKRQQKKCDSLLWIERNVCVRVFVCAKVIIREAISHHFSMDKHFAISCTEFACIPHSCAAWNYQLLYYSTNTPWSIDYIAKTSVCGGAAEAAAAATATARVFAINVLYLLCV